MNLNGLVLVFSLFLISCNHTIAVRRAHFLTPQVADEQWDGKLMFAVHNPARIELLENFTSNPPVRGEISINESADLSDVLALNNMSLDINLNVYKSLEIISEGALLGLKWQFLNHATKQDAWVASLMLAKGGFIDTSSNSDEQSVESAETDVDLKQLGLSLGFVSKIATPYISAVYQEIAADTNITNDHGSFGPYKDEGIHTSYAIGIDFNKNTFNAGIEYNLTHIKWANQSDNQEDIAFRLGFKW